MPEIEGTYFHVRVLIGMVVGLSIGNLLRGVARVISDEKHRPIYWVQMAWALSMLGAILNFWWWEIRFDLLPRFTFPIFAFWVCYVLQLFFMAYLHALGPMYPVRSVVFVGGCLLAIRTRNPVFHGAFVVVVLAAQLLWFARMGAIVL